MAIVVAAVTSLAFLYAYHIVLCVNHVTSECLGVKQ